MLQLLPNKRLVKRFSIISFSFLLVGLFIFAFSDNKPAREIILTKNAPQPIGPYSQAVRVGNTLYVAGQVGLTPAGKLDTSSVENECRQALNNVKAILEAAGMNMQHVVKATLFVKDLKHFQKINEVYGTYFQKDPPARETVQVSALPKGANFEISVVAVK
jgi:2-iminobutanoate/2-iminopropanoate deaminase